MFNKKGIVGIIILLIIIIIIIVILVAVARVECRKDSHCGEDYYCGADNKCHQHKVIYKEVKNSYVAPSLVIGFAIVISAIILRRKGVSV